MKQCGFLSRGVWSAFPLITPTKGTWRLRFTSSFSGFLRSGGDSFASGWTNGGEELDKDSINLYPRARYGGLPI